MITDAEWEQIRATLRPWNEDIVQDTCLKLWQWVERRGRPRRPLTHFARMIARQIASDPTDYPVSNGRWAQREYRLRFIAGQSQPKRNGRPFRIARDATPERIAMAREQIDRAPAVLVAYVLGRAKPPKHVIHRARVRARRDGA